jgi:hypothetical protein
MRDYAWTNLNDNKHPWTDALQQQEKTYQGAAVLPKSFIEQLRDSLAQWELRVKEAQQQVYAIRVVLTRVEADPELAKALGVVIV